LRFSSIGSRLDCRATRLAKNLKEIGHFSPPWLVAGASWRQSRSGERESVKRCNQQWVGFEVLRNFKSALFRSPRRRRSIPATVVCRRDARSEKRTCQAEVNLRAARGFVLQSMADLWKHLCAGATITFAATDVEGVRRRLQSRNVKLRESIVPRTGDTQFFLHDPDGVGVELNFPRA
jgi:hypothetical protein